jgi:hypothetical protein
MEMKKFGDSYDIVKQSLLRWSRDFGQWSVHPLFTEPVLPTEVTAYEELLGARVIYSDDITKYADRSSYLSQALTCGNLFLDPNTGLRVPETSKKEHCNFLFASELLQLAEKRPESLTMVFDQSLRRGFERLSLEPKLQYLRDHRMFGFAYVSHACFVIAGMNQQLVIEAHRQIVSKSRLPNHRFLTAPTI